MNNAINNVNQIAAIDFAEVVRQSRVEVRYGEGSWDAITIYVSRKWDDTAHWDIELSASSFRAESTEAIMAYAAAIELAAVTMVNLRDNMAELEAAHQQQRAKARAAFEAEVAAKAARREADAPLAKATVDALLARMAAAVTVGEWNTRPSEVRATMKPRGEETTHTVSATRSRSGMTKYQLNGSSIGRKVLVTRLTTDYSAASCQTIVDKYDPTRTF